MSNPEIQFKQYQPDYSGMVLRDYAFAEMEDLSGIKKEYRLDLLLPEGNSVSLPVVFFIHGGGFLPPCDRRQAYISWIAKRLTAEGYAVVSPDYPLFRDEAQMAELGGESAGYSLAGNAVHLACRYLRENRQKLGLDTDRISIMGGSAGSMTAFYAISEHEDRYRAFINLWGVPERLPDLHGFPPTLSVHGTADRLVPFERETELRACFAEYGVDHRLIELPEMGHTPLGKMDVFMPEILALLNRTMEA